jgi:transcriptional regulator with XRE-family HTH domain
MNAHEKSAIRDAVTQLLEEDYREDFQVVFELCVQLLGNIPDIATDELRLFQNHSAAALARDNFAEARMDVRRAERHLEQAKYYSLSLALTHEFSFVAKFIQGIERIGAHHLDGARKRLEALSDSFNKLEKLQIAARSDINQIISDIQHASRLNMIVEELLLSVIELLDSLNSTYSEEAHTVISTGRLFESTGRQNARPLRPTLAGNAGSGLTGSDDTKLPRVRLMFSAASLIADLDTGLETSFVSYEWLNKNSLIEATVSDQMVAQTIGESIIVGATVSIPCVLMDGAGSTRSIVLRCFAVKDSADGPLGRAHTSRFAILGRNVLYDNNITAKIDPSGELFFEQPTTVQDILPEPVPEGLTPPRRRDAVASEAAKRQNHVRLNGALLSSLRESKGLFVRELAAKAKISESTLRAAENGRWIKFETAGKIATALDTHFSNLVGDLESGDRNTSALPPAEAIPNAEPRAIQFTGGADGPIDVTAVTALGEHLRGDAGQIEDYAEIRFKADALSSLGSNRLGRLAGPTKRFIGLADDIKQVRAKLFWSRANTLRILWQDHQEATKGDTFAGERDERLLEATTASQLKDLVETINAFVVNDPVLMELDSVRPGPQDAETAREEAETLAPVLGDLSTNEAVATKDARDAVIEQLDNIGFPNSTLAGRQTNEFARRSLRNFVGELLRRAYQPIQAMARVTKSETGIAWKGIREGVYRTIGGALISATATDLAGVTNFSGAFVNFVVRHAESLILYVTKTFQNPQLVEIIHWIVRLGG